MILLRGEKDGNKAGSQPEGENPVKALSSLFRIWIASILLSRNFIRNRFPVAGVFCCIFPCMIRPAQSGSDPCLWLVEADHVTWILASDWLTMLSNCGHRNGLPHAPTLRETQIGRLMNCPGVIKLVDNSRVWCELDDENDDAAMQLIL